MNLLEFFTWFDDFLAIPTVIMFFGTGIVLTFFTRFVQIRAFPLFIRLITKGMGREKQEGNAINSFHALFASMATSIGVGSVVGPSVAIVVGGPGALFWLLVYIFFGSVIKFTEVTFAMHTRTRTPDGKIIGGPMQYLKSVSPYLANWYNVLVILMLVCWSGVQANTLANILALEAVPHWVTGIGIATFAFVVLSGGAKRMGAMSSKLVPLMFVLYVGFALTILLKDLSALFSAVTLVLQSITTSTAAIGGFSGASIFAAMRMGILRGVFITEAGVGTSSIPHAMSDAKRPVDQGILAMCAMVSDMLLVTISGLLILVTGVWMKGVFTSTLIYEAFKMNSPTLGRYILIISISLFVLTTAVGNSFNGMQSYSALTRYRWVKGYIVVVVAIIFVSALMPMPLIWKISDIAMVFVAVPNLIGLLTLAFRERSVLSIKSNNR